MEERIVGLSGIRGNHGNDWAAIKLDSLCIEYDWPDHADCMPFSSREIETFYNVRHYTFDAMGFQTGYSKRYYIELEREAARLREYGAKEKFGF